MSAVGILIHGPKHHTGNGGTHPWACWWSNAAPLCLIEPQFQIGSEGEMQKPRCGNCQPDSSLPARTDAAMHESKLFPEGLTNVRAGYWREGCVPGLHVEAELLCMCKSPKAWHTTLWCLRQRVELRRRYENKFVRVKFALNDAQFNVRRLSVSRSASRSGWGSKHP